MSKYTQTPAQTSFCTKLKGKSTIKCEKKQSAKQNSEKHAFKQATFKLIKPKTSKLSKKPATPQKSKQKFAGKPQGWPHCFDKTSAQPDFAFVNCSDVVMSVFNLPISTRSLIFCSYELSCRSVECIFLRYPNIVR